MAVNPIIIEDTETTPPTKYKVYLAGGKLSLIKLPDGDTTPVTSGAVIEDDISGLHYVFRLSGGKLVLTSVDDGTSDVIEVQLSSSWPAVHQLSDGYKVDAKTLNKPLQELTERTGYLYDKLRVFNRENPMATLVLVDAPLSKSDTPSVGDIVYLDADEKVYAKALAGISLFDSFTASKSSLAVGMLIARGGTRGKIAFSGLVDLAGLSIDVGSIVESDEKFRDGVYYLSCNEPGKITAFPSGPRVFIGTFIGKTKNGATTGDYAVLSIEHKDLAESHVHRSYLLSGLPAGGQRVDIDDPTGHHEFLGFAPDEYLNPERDKDVYPDTDIYPRIVFTGEWLSSEDYSYRFVLGGPVADDEITRADQLKFGNNPGVYIHWYNKKTGTEGHIQVESFNTRYPVEYGMFVELRKPTNTDEDGLVYRVELDSEDKRTWERNMTFPAVACGWRDLTEEELAKFGGPESGKPKFVYNIGFDRAMQTYYPPIPVGSAALVLNGVELSSKSLGGKFVYSIEPDSIYWYDDTWGHAPWPLRYYSRYSAPGDWEEHRLVLHFTKATTAETGPVTSLRARKGSGIKVYRCGSDSINDVGDLELDFDPLGDVEDDELEGYKVVKAGSNGKFKTGPVVEKIIAGAGIKLTRWGSDPKGQGRVIISTSAGSLQGAFEEVALQNAKQDMIGMFPYIRLLGWSEAGQNIPSAFILKFHVPADDADSVYVANLYANVFGTQPYADSRTKFAGIRLDYNILPDLNPVDTGDGTYQSANVQDDLIKPDESRVLEVPLLSTRDDEVVTYKAFDPVLIHTKDDSDDVPAKMYSVLGEKIPNFDECSKYLAKHETITRATFGIRPGYTVAVRISRNSVVSGVDEYTGPIGFINMRWSLDRVV